MAADFIVVDRSKQAGNQLVRAAALLRELRETLDSVQDAGNHGNDGSTYTLMASVFGIDAGSCANVLTLIGLLVNILNTNTDVTGANRLAQIDEFVGRLTPQ